jgi:hypothetical protein
MEIARNAFIKMKNDMPPVVIARTLSDLGIPQEIIDMARVDMERERQESRKRSKQDRDAR